MVDARAVERRYRDAVLIRMRLLIVAATLIASSAAAAPPRPDEKGYDPAFARWFQSLRTHDGAPCCSVADCRAVEYRLTGDGYEIHPLRAYDDRIAPGEEQRWTRVPEAKILRRTSNPTGHAIACYAVIRRMSAPVTLGIYCFVPATEM
ncbi:MAG: hypothetical protein J0I21_01610 [Alphaproteobacteria bacterium]|nr:hypothetical protein [Alphaproteobacteria bacterium]